MKQTFIAIVICMVSITVSAQNFILDERSTERYSNYWDQVRLVEKSLLADSISGKLQRSKKFNMNRAQFKTMSALFKKGFPKDFYKTDLNVVGTDDIKSDVHFVRWTYAKIAGKDVVPYVQLVVYFEVGENIKRPEVSGFEVVTKERVKLGDENKIIKDHQALVEKHAALPPPPPPPR